MNKEMLINLKEKLADYDLIITHYGLTAFESLYANCAIILCSPTKLHEELAKKYNFAYVGYNNICEENFKNALNNENLFPKKILNDSEENLFEYLQFISKGHKYNCPVCQKENDDEIISRNETRTYRRCKSCGLIYISFSCDKEKEYKKEYFFEDYKKQYGKTYQEDFESIKKQGLKRAAVIKNIYKSKNNNLLSGSDDTNIRVWESVSNEPIKLVDEREKEILNLLNLEDLKNAKEKITLFITDDVKEDWEKEISPIK